MGFKPSGEVLDTVAFGQVAFLKLPGETVTVSSSSKPAENTGTPKKPTEAQKRKGPFLPGTVLLPGAYGKTVGLMQNVLQGLYEEGELTNSLAPKAGDIQSTDPGYNLDHLQEYASNRFGEYTLRALHEYIHKGKAVNEKFRWVLEKKAARQEYSVDQDLWKSLGLEVGETLSDIFELMEPKGDWHVRVSLKGNEITIEYKPRFVVIKPIESEAESKHYAMGANQTVKQTIVVHTELDFDDPDFQLHVDLALRCLNRWGDDGQKELAKALGKSFIPVYIQGVSTKIKMVFYGNDGQVFDPLNVTDYSKLVPTKRKKCNYTIRVGIPTQAMAMKSVVWSVNAQVGITAGNVFSNGNNLSPEHYQYTLAHELGHVLGLWDAYPYDQHFDGLLGNILGEYGRVVERGFGNFITPDGTGKTTGDIMDNGRYASNTEYEMILFAWQNNRLQSYVGGALPEITGEISQAFLY